METVHRLVHLDLKGAPPRLAYYEWFFEYISKLGATGILIEYEDMFPYNGPFEEIKLPYAYSVPDIQQIQSMAFNNNLIVVPLVQTFGHLEFLLKHKRYSHLVEGKEPFSICSVNEESLRVVEEMVDQVIQQHPNITYFHIGADEVFQLGECERCQRAIKEEGKSKASLFLGYVTKLLKDLRGKYDHIKWLMWDDMLRQINADVLKASDLGSLVEPMVWSYTPYMQTSPEHWRVFSEVFPSYWAATAFKGATGIDKFYTDIGYHINNHLCWLAHIKQCNMAFSGIVLTGWTRYTHFHPFCELLPSAIPSLTLCMLVIRKGGYDDECKAETEKLLKFSQPLHLNPAIEPSENHCEYPGSGLYSDTLVLLSLYKRFDQLIITEKHLFNQEELSAEKDSILETLRELEQSIQKHLSEVFYEATVEEWMSYHIKSLCLKWEAVQI